MGHSTQTEEWLRRESPSRRAVRELTAQGWSPRQISTELGISTQVIYQHLKKLREQGKLEEAS